MGTGESVLNRLFRVIPGLRGTITGRRPAALWRHLGIGKVGELVEPESLAHLSTRNDPQPAATRKENGVQVDSVQAESLVAGEETGSVSLTLE